MKTTIIEKIKKLLSLAESNEPHEAALALKRARSLMDKYGISISDLKVAELAERRGKGGIYKTPPLYVTMLADVCANLFECGVYYSTQTSLKGSYYRKRIEYETYPVFVGPEPNNEICGYTYDVLFRKLVSARRKYKTREYHKYLVTSAKDSYAIGWVEAIKRKVADMVPPKPDPTISDETGIICLTPVEAYINEKCGDSFQSRRSSHNESALISGYADGHNVDIRKGMGTTGGLTLNKGGGS
ncbi:MAG: DUF2786 domain-containing protein [Bacteroidota bacterium]